MNTKSLSLLAVLFFLGIGSSFAQQAFSIKIESHKDRIRMTCTEGCAWEQLEFNLSTKSQAIDEYGMTSVKSASSIKSDDLADFLFVIERKSGGLHMKGVEGTQWTDTDIKCPLENCIFVLGSSGIN